MKDLVIRWILNWLADNLTKELVEQWAEQVKQYLFPKLREAKDKAVEWAKAEAAKSDTKIDDAAAQALDDFLDALLPDNPKVL